MLQFITLETLSSPAKQRGSQAEREATDRRYSPEPMPATAPGCQGRPAWAKLCHCVLQASLPAPVTQRM